MVGNGTRREKEILISQVRSQFVTWVQCDLDTVGKKTVLMFGCFGKTDLA